MRARPLSDSSVIDLLNSSFVCVYVNNEDYRSANGSASADERKELARIREEALEKKLSVGTVHAYVLTPDGHAVDSAPRRRCRQAGKNSLHARAGGRMLPAKTRRTGDTADGAIFRAASQRRFGGLAPSLSILGWGLVGRYSRRELDRIAP